MWCEIITIGDEILIGQIIDTNSAWIATELNLIGIRIKQITSIADEKTHIKRALDEAKIRADIIIITGGLGPTKDDITKKVLCEYFNTELIFNEMVFHNIETLFDIRNKSILEIDRKQAEIPVDCIPLYNLRGTAPGMWFEEEGKIFISLPGVPYEMKSIMEKHVIPKLKQDFKLPAIFHKTVLTTGIGESPLSELIKDWETALPPHIKLAYLPSPGIVRLRLSAYGENYNPIKHETEGCIKDLESIISDYIFGYDKETIEEIIGKLLLDGRKTISTAESCTGGYIAHQITRVAGSSAYYKGSIIAYSYDSKETLLSVDSAIIKKYGAVSEEVVKAMALACQKRFKTDYVISCSGIAGPTGETIDKPVGTVWVALATPSAIIAKRHQFGTSRGFNIQITSITALNMLRREILKTVKT